MGGDKGGAQGKREPKREKGGEKGKGRFGYAPKGKKEIGRLYAVVMVLDLKDQSPLRWAHFFNSSFVVPGTSLLSLFPRPRKRHWSFKLGLYRSPTPLQRGSPDGLNYFQFFLVSAFTDPVLYEYLATSSPV